jgi:hypothetical protein
VLDRSWVLGVFSDLGDVKKRGELTLECDNMSDIDSKGSRYIREMRLNF